MDHIVDNLLQENSAEFDRYFELLVEWNDKFNLTAITDREGVFVKHFKDSLLGERFVKENAKVLDIGAGAGFPSLPIKIVRPDIDLTLVDSVGKKVTVLSEVIGALNLKSAKALHLRAEDIKEREFYDCVLSRAVANLSTLAEYCLPFVKKGGYFVAYKSSDCAEEIAGAENAIKILGGKVESVERLPLDEQTERCFVIIKKVEITPKKYPRGKNLPRKTPL